MATTIKWSLLLCLIAALSIHGKDIHSVGSSLEKMDDLPHDKDSNPMDVAKAIEDTPSDRRDIVGPIRLPRKYLQDESRFRRLRILDRRTALDGKVQSIRVNADEEKPGVRAYGLPKKQLRDNGEIERKPVDESEISNGHQRNEQQMAPHDSPIQRSPTENNDTSEKISMTRRIEKYASGGGGGARVSRSIDDSERGKDEPTDLEAQDAKVFRPLFVYRQQVARRQQRQNRKKAEHFNTRYNALHGPCRYVHPGR